MEVLMKTTRNIRTIGVPAEIRTGNLLIQVREALPLEATFSAPEVRMKLSL
jgi:hypothetical protein